MIYRVTPEGKRYVYILGEESVVWQQELDGDAFVGQATRVVGGKLRIAKDMYDACGVLPNNTGYVEKLMTKPNNVTTIHDDIVTMRKR